MKKRCLSFLLSLVLFSGFLSSCTTETPPPSSADVTSSPAQTSTATPAPTPSWQDAYAELLRENIPTSKVDFETFVDGSDEEIRFSAFSAGGYPVTPFFYLYDIDKDGVPELIYIDAASGYDGDVYAYKNHSISKMGSINFYPFGSLGIPLDKTEGLYSDVGYKEHNGEIFFYTINNGVLTGQMVLEYNNQPELSPAQPGLPHSFDNFTWLDYYEVTEANITNVIYGGVWKDSYYSLLCTRFPSAESADNNIGRVVLFDLDFDGIPEIFLEYSYAGEPYLFAGYTFRDGESVEIAIPNASVSSALNVWKNDTDGRLIWVTDTVEPYEVVLGADNRLEKRAVSLNGLRRMDAAMMTESVHDLCGGKTWDMSAKTLRKDCLDEFFALWDGRLPYADTAALLEAKASEIAAAPPEFNPYRDSESSIQLSANNRVVNAAVGDLNGDGIPDLVAVVEHAPAGRFDDRDVYVLLGKNDGTYVVAHKSRSLILRHDEGGVFGEPFEGAFIENGVLTIDHYGGSSSRWGYMMQFQYINGQFELVRLEYTSFSTHTANGEQTDCDFLKHTIKRYTWSDWETEPIPLYSGTLPDTVCLFEEAGFDEIASYGDIPFLPYLGYYAYDRFDEPLKLSMSASEALDRIQKTYYPDMKKVYIPWTQENRDNYSKLLFYEVPDYYYEGESGKLEYFELDVPDSEGIPTDFTHCVIFHSSGDGDMKFYDIDDRTGKID